MTTDREILAAVVAANPADVTARLVLADAIAEQTGDYDRAKLEACIAAFVAHVDTLSAKNFADRGYTFSPPPTHRADYISDKWCRIVVVDHTHDGGSRDSSVYCFVCLKDNTTRTLGHVRAGDIHKAASFKSPARVARGTVFASDFGNCANAHGVAYLR